MKKSQSGQYMVEFGMTFIFFIFIILAVINLILIGYNFNLGQRASWEAVRLAAVGATNKDIGQIVYDQFGSQMIASPFLVSQISFDSTTFITPNNYYQRIEGQEVEVNLGYKTGFILFSQTVGIVSTFPIRSRLYVTQKNDQDRDGFFDTTTVNTYADSRQTNHDNDATSDVSDTDWDNDGRANVVDTGKLTWNGASYLIDTGAGFRTHIKISGGRFSTRVINVLSDGSYDSGTYPFRPLVIPRTRIGTWISMPIYVDLSYDKNNNAWEDKYDN